MNVLDAKPCPPQVERDRDLHEELLHRAAAEDVVEDSQAGDGQAAEEECEGAAAVGVEDAAEARRVEDEREQGRVESGDDCNATEARHARGMHLARARDVIEQTATARESPDHRYQRSAHEGRAGEGDDLGPQGIPPVSDVEPLTPIRQLTQGNDCVKRLDFEPHELFYSVNRRTLRAQMESD